MSTTISATTDAPGITARFRLPRHHHAQRDQAVADALELVRRLEAVADHQVRHDAAPDTDHQVSDDPTPDIAPCQCGEYAEAVNHDEIVRLINSPDAADAIALIEWGCRWGALTEGAEEEFMDSYGFTLGETPHERFPVFPGVLDEFAKDHHLVDSVRTFAILRHIERFNRGREVARRLHRQRAQEEAAGAEIMDRIEAEMAATTKVVEQLIDATRDIAADDDSTTAEPGTPYERIRAQRDRVWVDWGEDGAPDHPEADQEARWHAQGIVEGLAMAMTVLEQEGQR